MWSAIRAARPSHVRRGDKMSTKGAEIQGQVSNGELPRHSVGVLRSVSLRIEREGDLVVLRFDGGGMVMLRADEARRAAKLLRKSAKKTSKK